MLDAPSLRPRSSHPLSRRGTAQTPGVEWFVDAGVLHVGGEVDAATAERFAMALDECDADPLIQALDLTAVRFFGAAGVSCFVRLGWLDRPHPPIIASPTVRQVLQLCDCDSLLDVHGWSPHALRSAASGRASCE